MSNKSYVKKLIEEDLRTDERKLDEFRKIKIETDAIKSAEGSARVRLGNSHILVGIKLGLGDPFPDTPNEGILIVNTELSPVASPTFEPGPPREAAIEMSRVIDRGIRESHCIDLEKLAITPGEKVWMINIDIHVLDHDGNLIDAGALGSIAALLNTKMPKLEDDKIIYEEKEGKLPIREKPIAITIGKIGDKLLIDPNFDEEDTLDARVTITTMENGNICSIQKGEKGYFTIKELEEAADLSFDKGKKLRKLL